jgi:hypothetical protein
VEAVKATTAPQEKIHVLPDAAGQPRKRFSGTHLAFASTGDSKWKRPRWLTLDLFRKADGTYVLHRTGYSVVYHAPDGCEGGEEMTLPELLEVTSEGVPCEKCSPMPFDALKLAVERGRVGETILLERVYYKVVEAATVPELVKALEFVPKTSVTGTPVISRPGQELLLRAAAHDGNIAATFEAIQDI